MVVLNPFRFPERSKGDWIIRWTVRSYGLRTNPAPLALSARFSLSVCFSTVLL